MIDEKTQNKPIKYGWPILLSLIIFFVSIFTHGLLDLDRLNSERMTAIYSVKTPRFKPILRVRLPEEVRGIYWTVWTAASSRGDELIDYINDYNLNTVVIDLKMDNGALAFLPLNQSLSNYTMVNPAIADLSGLLERLGELRIYRIARVAVMRDDTYALQNPAVAVKYSSGNLWQDNTGSYWLDPAADEVADYAVDLGKEAWLQGFDEIQYDYVRFPSDGVLSSIVYPVYTKQESKQSVMQDFFAKVGGIMLAAKIPVSFDVFGMTFINNSDYGIGQRLVDVYPYTDFVSPMVYPSHYADNFKGFANPAEHPYEIVYLSLEDGVDQLVEEFGVTQTEARKKIRPWLQDFDIGAIYTSDLIEAQIKAARDSSASGWLLWNARNVYEPSDYL
jgi:hypothetical protein